MGIKCDQYSQVCVVAIDGEFNGEAAALVRKAVEERIEQQQIVDYVIDFEKSGFMDSDGLEALLWIKRRAEDLFGQFKIVGLDEHCQKILEITRLAQRFETHPDLATAMKTMR